MSRAAFVAAAVGLLQREGAGAVTLRRVAGELDTGPASLYAHVRTIQELHALLVDDVLSAVDLHPELADSPRQRIRAVLAGYESVLLSHRGLGQLASGVLSYGENSIALTDCLVACLLGLDLSAGRAAWGSDLLLLHSTAIMAELDQRRIQVDPVGRARTAYEQADPARYPNLAAVRDELFTGGASRGAWVHEVLMLGITTAPEPHAMRP